MIRTLVRILCILSVAFIFVHSVFAQVETYNVFMPLVVRPPAPPPDPTPACTPRAPAASEGARAWMDEPNPPQNATVTACVRLILSGKAIANTPAKITVRYKTTTSNYTGTSKGNGVAPISFQIGRATKGYRVVVEAVVTYQGKPYTAQTSFTPQ